MAVPPVLPDPPRRETKRLGRGHWGRMGTCDYSVHALGSGRRVDDLMDGAGGVLTCAGGRVARPPGSWARHRTVTDPAHERARQVMPALAAGAVGSDDDVEVRDLSVYDRATGVA